MWMWAVVPSEPLCLHTQSLATAKNMQEYASAQRMIILFLRGLHEGRSENTNQVKSEKRLPEQIGNWLGGLGIKVPECITYQSQEAFGTEQVHLLQFIGSRVTERIR
eukprot:TRINITY_DN50_c0_g1_i25.p1 TRINITY_DN50_c0_g1~~TRINITY_DN50_c0_g1_i25.p1  ORF type:complete len:107 (+),score=2.80 TRINITY_DN50_c0_g1_i25:67-387(+)